MTEDRLPTLLEAYGADPARWPEADRHAGAALANRRDLADALAEARRLDGQLDAYRAPEASARLRQAILDRTRQVPQERRLSLAFWLADMMPLRPLWPNLASLSLALLLGLAAGFSDLGTTEADAATPAASIFGIESLDDFVL
jgi:hypothetical protein